MKTIKNKSYNSIDNFRLLAAFMVIAIHTFPFSSYNKNLDSIITLTLFRIAVPFFFMISGYFLIGPYSKEQNYINETRINKNIIKLFKLYFITIIIYLPLSILNKSINLNISFLELLKLIIFDGTFYHLWYFPATILGIFLVKNFIKYFGFNISFFISILLYIIGLFGDSYSGIINNNFIENILNIIFKFSSYTRNGIFFAPLFLLLGALIFRNKKYFKNLNYLGLIFSIILLFIEGYFVNIKNTPKHNSMYIFLIPTVYFLFNILANKNSNKKFDNVKDISLIIYIIHPIIIYILYLFGKFIKPIENSIINYILVSVLSFIISFLISNINFEKFKNKKINKNEIENQKNIFRTKKYIYKENIIHNLNEIKSIIHDTTDIMAVVKTNAYGHNSKEFCKVLESQGVNYFAVATIDEAIELRISGVKGNILIFAYTPIDRIDEIIYYDLTITIVDYEYAKKLNHLSKKVKVHLKIDTGMHRLGIDCFETEKIINIYKMKYIDVQGIYSHLGSSDALDTISKERTKMQIDRFDSIICILKSKKINTGLTHLQSSYGILNYSYLKYDLVRVGILLYGVQSSSLDEPIIKLNLKPTLRLTGRLIEIQNIDIDEYIGYGLNYKTNKKTKIGIISTGYGDGIPRNISDKNYLVSFNNNFFPVIGRICMDMLIVDITDVDNINIDDEIILIENPEYLAKKSNTLTNEVLSRIGSRTIDIYK